MHDIQSANAELLKKRKLLGITSKPPIPDYDSKLRAAWVQPVEPEVLEQWLESEPPAQAIEPNWEHWHKFNFYHPSLQAAKRQIVSWYNGGSAWGLMLAGRPGCGKTEMTRALYEILTPLEAAFFTELDVVSSIQASFNNDPSGKPLEFWAQRAERAKVLIYDDLGAYETENKAWLRNIYYRLFNDRLENRQTIVFTTNIRLIQSGKSNSPMLDLVGERLYSRIIDQIKPLARGYINLFDVPDYRLKGM